MIENEESLARWRQEILKDLPEKRVSMKAVTFESAAELIKIAAYNRRMGVEEFIGRAALAFAVHDSGNNPSWEQATKREPPMRDLRRHNLPRRRLFGRGFGKWEIERLR